jgi:hypothetical protein
MPHPSIGARSATGRKRKPLGWLPWLLLVILAIVIALVVLIVVRNRNDNDSAPARPVVTLVVTQPAAA